MAFDKTEMRRQKAARMEASGLFTDLEIAEEIGLTVSGYTNMKRSPEYREILTAVKTGITSSLDASIGEDTLKLRERIRSNIPAALSTIFDCIQQRQDKKLALAASELAIKIDGRFSPVVRTGTALPEQGGSGEVEQLPEDKLADAMLAALDKRVIKSEIRSQVQESGSEKKERNN